MEGVDIHLDTNVGKQLSALGHTLTSLTGAEDPLFHVDYDSDDNEPTDGTRTSQESILPSFMFDPSLDNKQRSKLIEKEMNEQAKIINDLRSLGASHGTIELELKRLHELEAMVYKDFRRYLNHLISQDLDLFFFKGYDPKTKETKCESLNDNQREIRVRFQCLSIQVFCGPKSHVGTPPRIR